MPSNAATYFNTKCRTTMHDLHGEVVTLVDQSANPSTGTRNLSVIWQRVLPQGDSDDGLGVSTYTGEAMACVTKDALPALPGPRAYLIREGENWSIRHVEPKDNWTYILHLARARQEARMPQRVRG
jgi:hypothetical protein